MVNRRIKELSDARAVRYETPEVPHAKLRALIDMKLLQSHGPSLLPYLSYILNSSAVDEVTASQWSNLQQIISDIYEPLGWGRIVVTKMKNQMYGKVVLVQFFQRTT